MKKLLLMLLAAALLFGCAAGGGGSSDPADIDTVEQLGVKDVAASGATYYYESMEDTMSFLDWVGSSESDPVVLALNGFFGGAEPKALAAGLFSLAGAQGREFSESFASQIEAAIEQFEGFAASKSLSVEIDASGEEPVEYLKITTGTAELEAEATTTDGGPILNSDEEGPSNLKTVSGEFRLSLAVDGQDLPAESYIKDFKLRINAGGEGGATSNASAGVPASDGSASFDYGLSCCAILSVAGPKGDGGIVVLKLEARNGGSIASFEGSSPSEPDFYAGLVPELSMSVALYQDDGTEVFKETFTDYAAVLTALGLDKEED